MDVMRVSRERFDPYDQHDSQEFIIFLLAGIQEELNPKMPKF